MIFCESTRFLGHPKETKPILTVAILLTISLFQILSRKPPRNPAYRSVGEIRDKLPAKHLLPISGHYTVIYTVNKHKLVNSPVTDLRLT